MKFALLLLLLVVVVVFLLLVIVLLLLISFDVTIFLVRCKIIGYSTLFKKSTERADVNQDLNIHSITSNFYHVSCHTGLLTAAIRILRKCSSESNFYS